MSRKLIDATHELIQSVAQLAPPAQRSSIAALHQGLTERPTVALSGRVSAGKSTLVNALVGADVAPTDAGECTRVATLFEFGAPERVEFVGFDGVRHRVNWPNRHRLPRQLVEIDYATAYTSQSCLRDRYRVVDTPGLSSHGKLLEAATRRALVESASMPRPDIVLFLVEGGHLRSDEVDFLNAMGASRLNTIIVVSRADTAGDGPLGETDPFDVAASHVRRILTDHPEHARSAVAVAGLMAQTAEVGITETQARAVAALRGVDEFELLLRLADDSEQELRHLDAQVGTYGLLHGRDAAAQGAVVLSQWLQRRSGLDQLHREISTMWQSLGEVLRVETVFDALEQAASTSPARADMSTVIERMRYRPALHRIAELKALRALERRSSRSPLRAELEHVVGAADATALFGIADPAMREIRRQQRVRHLQREGLAVRASAERNALAVLERTYHLAATGLR